MPQSIGIFDSGVGGLTVVREMRRLLPLEDITYLGDTARLPYGTKSRDTVVGYSRRNSHFLISRHAKIIIAACNTASAYSIDTLSSEFGVPVLGVIHPGAEKAARVTKNGKIGVIATPSTIRSGAYAYAIKAADPSLKAMSASCPLFVPLAEEGWNEDEIALAAARRYLEPVKSHGVDTLILGCTHYPLMKKIISEVMGDGVTLVDSAAETASKTAEFMEKNGLLNPDGGGKERFYLTDGSDSFLKITGRFLGREPAAVEIVDIA